MAVINVTKENYNQEVLASDRPVLMDFWAKWCGPCRAVSPIVDEIAAQHPEVKVVKIDVDEQAQLASQFDVMSIPTLVVMKNSKIAARSVGVRSKQQILQMLRSLQ